MPLSVFGSSARASVTCCLLFSYYSVVMDNYGSYAKIFQRCHYGAAKKNTLQPFTSLFFSFNSVRQPLQSDGHLCFQRASSVCCGESRVTVI